MLMKRKVLAIVLITIIAISIAWFVHNQISERQPQKSQPNVKITGFSHEGPYSVVFGETDWFFNASVQNMGSENVSGITLEVELDLSSGQVFSNSVQLDTLVAGETQRITGNVLGAGVSVNFNMIDSAWNITLKLGAAILDNHEFA